MLSFNFSSATRTRTTFTPLALKDLGSGVTVTVTCKGKGCPKGLSDALGVLDHNRGGGRRSWYGRTYWGNQRATFIIDEEGVVRHVIPKVSPKTHDDEVLAALGDLPAAA